MGRVHRLYVEKKPPFAREAEALCAEFRGVLGVAGLERVRVLNRYDVEGLEAEALSACVGAVFADPCTDDSWISWNPGERKCAMPSIPWRAVCRVI